MPVEFYLESGDRPSQSGVADEQIETGTLVFDDGEGVVNADFADGDYDGVALYDHVLDAFDEDDVADEVYQTDERVQYHPDEGGAVVRVRTAKDNGTDPAASVSHKDVVGVLDDGATVSSAAEFKGRIVEEGYVDDAGTTYNRSNNNFLALGKAYRPAKQNGDTVNTFNEPVRVETFGELQS